VERYVGGPRADPVDVVREGEHLVVFNDLPAARAAIEQLDRAALEAEKRMFIVGRENCFQLGTGCFCMPVVSPGPDVRHHLGPEPALPAQTGRAVDRF
jgi:hypothetical protein